MTHIAIAGLGTVGTGVVRLLEQNAALIAERSGRPFIIKAVSSRDQHKKRNCNLNGATWVADPRQLPFLPEIDVVVELIGGADGMAYEVAHETLKAGKSLVTANKALLAKHGVDLAKLAESMNAQIYFEASVAGGIPIIKTMREGLAGNQLTSVRGILNGTCNYILTRMREAALDFNAALLEAQHLGYAETDPSADIDGHDTANKLAVLSAIAFGVEPSLSTIHLDGIRHITPLDLHFAEELGCRIKLLGVARQTASGLEQYVGPSLVSKNSSLARINGALNAVSIHGNFVGDITIEGAGAGAGPTASAVVADIIDCARGYKAPLFGIPAARLKKLPSIETGSEARYYMRLQVIDRPGVVADVSAVLRDANISIETLLQRAKSATESVPVVITTHEARPKAMQEAIAKISELQTVKEKPCLLRIED